MKAAVYARYSTDMQRATSIDDQVAAARRYAAQERWHVLNEQVYSDAGISGSSLDGRPGIQALLEAAAMKPRPFDVLLVDDSSRVARDLADAVRFIQRLRFHGVRVIYISQQIDSDNEQAETMVAVHGIVDGLYLKEMRKKIQRGLAGQLERGLATGGITFGYRSVPQYDPTGKIDSYRQPIRIGCKLEIDDVEATTVRRIFERYASGAGVGLIAEELNTAGIDGPRGRLWRYNTVRWVLNNERYCGFQIWGQRTHERRPGTRRNVARSVASDKWHRKVRPELRIVGDDLWGRVQTRFKLVAESVCRQAHSNLLRGRSPRLHSTHLFSGLARCGRCGGAIGVVSGGAGSSRYGCVHSWRNGRTFCDNRLTIRVKVADATLLAGLQAQLRRPDTVSYVSEMISERLASMLRERPQRQETLESKRAEVRAKLENLVRALEGGASASAVVQAIHAREQELAVLDQELGEPEYSVEDNLTVIPTWVQQQLSDLAQFLREDSTRVREHFRQLNLDFTFSPVSDEGRPFLRVAVNSDLAPLPGLGQFFPSAASGESHPRAVPGSRLRGRFRPLY